MRTRPCGMGQPGPMGLSNWSYSLEWAEGEKKKGAGGSVRSSPLMKLDSQECEGDDGQTEPQSQGHLPADGLCAV